MEDVEKIFDVDWHNSELHLERVYVLLVVLQKQNIKTLDIFSLLGIIKRIKTFLN